MALYQGSRGPAVRRLQVELKALGYYNADIDSRFGPQTLDAVCRFQEDTAHLLVDGRVGPATRAALEQALVVRNAVCAPAPAAAVCTDKVWDAFTTVLLPPLTDTPVRYGPGRGLFNGEAFVITRGPRGLRDDRWSSVTGNTYPSFHCSSFTNFFLGWVTGRDAGYTHAGNIPSLFTLCEADATLHRQQGAAAFAGYGPCCVPIDTDGSSRQRLGFGNAMDVTEVFARRHTLPSFCVFAQSTRRADGTWKWWHHTGVFAVDHRAADRVEDFEVFDDRVGNGFAAFGQVVVGVDGHRVAGDRAFLGQGRHAAAARQFGRLSGGGGGGHLQHVGVGVVAIDRVRIPRPPRHIVAVVHQKTNRRIRRHPAFRIQHRVLQAGYGHQR